MLFGYGHVGWPMERSVDIDRYAIWNNFTISGFVTSFPVYLHVVRIRACEVSMERSLDTDRDAIWNNFTISGFVTSYPFHGGLSSFELVLVKSSFNCGKLLSNRFLM